MRCEGGFDYRLHFLLVAETLRRASFVGGAQGVIGCAFAAQLVHHGIHDGWLVLSADARGACLASDHALDAFLSALVACAAATDDTIKPTVDQRGMAHFEGWIHLPEPQSLARLSSRGT